MIEVKEKVLDVIRTTGRMFYLTAAVCVYATAILTVLTVYILVIPHFLKVLTGITHQMLGTLGATV